MRHLTSIAAATAVSILLTGAAVFGCSSSTVGNSTASSTAESPREFVGSSWWLASYSSDTGCATRILEDADISVTFDTDGQFGGLAGCNSYWGTYTADGHRLTVESLDSTKAVCSEPAGIMEQEQAYLRALQNTATFDIEGDKLTLSSSEGKLLASFDVWTMPPGG
jgi:heat shock protein HslJ